MRILQITQEPPFDPAEVATGNALRAAQLHASLSAAGHELSRAWLDPGGRARECFGNADELRGRIRAINPDVLLVAYWELLALLPWEPEMPVVVDFIAPRPLETLFEDPARVAPELRRLRVNLRKADLLLVGNDQQAQLLDYWLLEAGFDLREGSPLRVVPLAGRPLEFKERDPATEGWTLVGGGVAWPWRDDAAYTRVLGELSARHSGRLQVVEFSGPYRWAAGEPPDTTSPTTLAAYADYSAFLAESAHVGLELGADNIERRHSQSFRSLDFLRHGLPLVCNEWLPIAPLIERYGAGWTVAGPDELEALVERLMDHPEEWRERRAGALRLVSEALDPERAIAPLLDWLKTPRRAARLPATGPPRLTEPVLGRPRLGERLRRRWRLARRVALARWLRRDGDDRPGEAVVMVTRGDLFPTRHGAAVKIVETARGLANNGREVLLVSDDRRRYLRFAGETMEQLALPLWLRALARPLAWVKLDHYTRDLPESNAFLYLPLTDGSFFRRTLWVAVRHRAAVLQAEFPAYALPCQQVGEVLGLPTVLVEHNVEYARLRQQVPALTASQFDHLRAIEIELGNRSDAVVCVSDNDRQRLAEDGVHPSLLHTIPHGIDLQSFDAAQAVAARARFGIPDQAAILAFHGTYAYPPNRDALQMFADEILPRLEAAGCAAHVLAVGNAPPARPPHPRIHLTGPVDSVAPWLKAADLAVIPLREGGGTRMKIIDCFAARLPVVSTAKGIEGIPVSDGREALIRDDWAGLCEATGRLLADAEEAARIARAARLLAEDLDWTAIAARYVKLYAALER